MKKVFNKVKDWIVANGIEGVAGLGAGLALWIFGYKIFAGVAFGIFIHKNWDIAKNAVKGKL
jgi:predicted small integral membrane protein